MTSPNASSTSAASENQDALARLRQQSGQVLFQNYKRLPVAFTHGEGTRLFGTDGRCYLDFIAGIATNSLGHGHPRLVRALQEQASRYLHVSNLFELPEQIEAAQRLVEVSRRCPELRGLDRAFFCNSGAEANEALIKLARRWAADLNEAETGAGSTPPPYRIVSTEGGFHGRTLGALAATGTPAYHHGFAPLPEGFRAVPFNDLEAMAEAIDEQTCAVLLEPIQGEGGVVPGTAEYLHGVQELCRERGVLLLLDEVQTGIGRTGNWFGFQEFGLEPDAIALAKGLGGGVPVGAVLATEELAQHLVPGTHGTTFGGNALAMAAVNAVIDALDAGVLEQVPAKGELLRERLERLADELPVQEVRGRGLMQAIEFEPTVEAAAVAQRCFEQGLLVNAVRPHAIRLLPPLVVTEDEITRAVEILAEALRAEVDREETP